MVQDPGPGFAGDEHAGAGIQGLFPSWMRASSRPAVTTRPPAGLTARPRLSGYASERVEALLNEAGEHEGNGSNGLREAEAIVREAWTP